MGTFSMCINTTWRAVKTVSDYLVVYIEWKRGSGHKFFKHKIIFYLENGWILSQVAPGGFWFSILRDIKNAAGHSPEQPAAAGTPLNGGFGVDGLQMSLPTLTILCFWNTPLYSQMILFIYLFIYFPHFACFNCLLFKTCQIKSICMYIVCWFLHQCDLNKSFLLPQVVSWELLD